MCLKNEYMEKLKFYKKNIHVKYKLWECIHPDAFSDICKFSKIERKKNIFFSFFL